MFPSNSAYVYISTSTHSHICYTHTLSLPLIHTHTLTQSKSGSYELIRFVEVEEIGFKSRLEGVGICNISNAQWQ